MKNSIWSLKLIVCTCRELRRTRFSVPDSDAAKKPLNSKFQSLNFRESKVKSPSYWSRCGKSVCLPFKLCKWADIRQNISTTLVASEGSRLFEFWFERAKCSQTCAKRLRWRAGSLAAWNESSNAQIYWPFYRTRSNRFSQLQILIVWIIF